MFKKNFSGLLDSTLKQIESLNYTEQFLELFADFFSKTLPLSGLNLFFLNDKQTEFRPYFNQETANPGLAPVTWEANLVIYLKNSPATLVLKNETEARVKFLHKTNPDLFEKLKIDAVIPLFSLKKLFGFVVIEANPNTFKELDNIREFFRVLGNILIPLVVSERNQIESDRNYYRIYRMDRLALVGELAASAAHEIKNPLAGISTFIKYFMELEDFKKQDIAEELVVMRQSVQRIDEIVKSLLSFSRYKKKEIKKTSLASVIDASLQSIVLKIPTHISLVKKIDEDLVVETDREQFQQVLVNIVFNAIEAIGKKPGEIVIHAYVSGRDRLPSKELFNISIKDNGPGIDESFKEKLFQPFQTTKEEGTGLGLFTCYGLMKSLGGDIKINSGSWGTEVTLSLPYSFEEEEGEER